MPGHRRAAGTGRWRPRCRGARPDRRSAPRVDPLRRLHTRGRGGPSGGGLSVKESEVRARGSTTGCPRPPRHTFFRARGTKRQRRQAGRTRPSSTRPVAKSASRPGADSHPTGWRHRRHDYFFQELVLHPQPADLVFHFLHAGALHRVQVRNGLRIIAPPEIDPIAQGALVDPQVAGDLGDGLTGLQHHLYGLSLELRAEPSPLLWHGQILSSSESLSKIVGTPQSPTYGANGCSTYRS